MRKQEVSLIILIKLLIKNHTKKIMSNSKKYFRKSKNDLFEFIIPQKMILFRLEIILDYESNFELIATTKNKNTIVN